MGISNDVKAKLNSMCLTATEAGLGNVIQYLQASPTFRAGKYVAVAADATAGTVDIETGVTVVSMSVQILRAGKDVTNKAAISASGTKITVATNSTDFILTKDDIIHWIAVGSVV